MEEEKNERKTYICVYMSVCDPCVYMHKVYHVCYPSVSTLESYIVRKIENATNYNNKTQSACCLRSTLPC